MIGFKASSVTAVVMWSRFKWEDGHEWLFESDLGMYVE
jgi:hypothetical protein